MSLSPSDDSLSLILYDAKDGGLLHEKLLLNRIFFIRTAKGDITHFIHSGYGDLIGTEEKKAGSVSARLVDSFDAFIGSGEEGFPLAAGGRRRGCGVVRQVQNFNGSSMLCDESAVSGLEPYYRTQTDVPEYDRNKPIKNHILHKRHYRLLSGSCKEKIRRLARSVVGVRNSVFTESPY
jgi:hypothetical protein